METEGDKRRVRVKVREKARSTGLKGVRPVDRLLIVVAGARVGLAVGYLAAGGLKRLFSSGDFSIRKERISAGLLTGKKKGAEDLFAVKEEGSETREGGAPPEEDPFLDFNDPS